MREGGYGREVGLPRTPPLAVYGYAVTQEAIIERSGRVNATATDHHAESAEPTEQHPHGRGTGEMPPGRGMTYHQAGGEPTCLPRLRGFRFSFWPPPLSV